MLKLPQSILFAIVAFNCTAFTLLLQFNLLVFNQLWAKALAWAVTIAAWALTYRRRNKFITLF